MRILGTNLELRSREMATSATVAASAPRRTAAGSDGTSLFTELLPGGYDFNTELAGHRKFMVYEEMRKSDAAVKSCLFMYKLPIRQADWALDAQSDDGIDQVIADAVAWQFGLEEQDGQLDLTWDEWLQQTMLFFDFGSFAEEIIDGDPVLWRPTGDDGTNSRIIRPFARFAPRFPGTVQEIDTDPVTGQIKRMKQLLPGADWIPGDALAWYAPDREGTDWFGTSLLRAMYGPWKLKAALMVSAAVGWDRYAYGTPVVRYPMGSGKKTEAQNIARDYRTHERAWVVFEGNKTEGWDLEIVNGAATMGDPVPLLRIYNEMIAEAALQQFSKLGTTATGARAVGEILIDPFYQAVATYAGFIAGRRQRDAIRKFVDINFGEQYEAPKIRVGKIQSKNVLVLSQAIEFLASAGMTFTDRETQNDVRDLLDLRHLPETVQQAVNDLPDDVGIQKEGDPVIPPDALPHVNVA